MNPTKVKVYNFNAGPAMLPAPVMEQAQKEFLDYMGTECLSWKWAIEAIILMKLFRVPKKGLQELLSIPENYSVIFIQVGQHFNFRLSL